MLATFAHAINSTNDHAHQHIKRAGILPPQIGDPAAAGHKDKPGFYPLLPPACFAEPDFGRKPGLNVSKQDLQSGGGLRDRDVWFQSAEDVEPVYGIVRAAQPVFFVGHYLRLHHHGDADIGRVAYLKPVEAPRGHADDGERASIDQDLRSDDSGRASHPALPPGEADDGHGMGAWKTIIVGSKHTTGDGLDAEHRIVVARYQLARR